MVRIGTQGAPVMASPGEVNAAVALIRSGQLIAFPTETVYGLGADASSSQAVAQIFAVKGRPAFNPLISHVATIDDARLEGEFGPAAEILANAFWPGPLTLIVPFARSGRTCELARAGLTTVGLRVLSHPIALELLRNFKSPLAAPSANRSGRVSPTTAAHVRTDLGDDVGLVIDGGPSMVGLESTIIDCTSEIAVLLRPGGIPRDLIESALGRRLSSRTGIAEAAPIAPGMLSSHYAPRAKVRLLASSAREFEAILDFGGQIGRLGNQPYFDLSPSGSVLEAAAHLFEALRRLDATGAEAIAVASIPMFGLGEAINDRLTRAANPRNG